ncbi:hypothetical protein D3C80_1645390 [compost metagenome]
MNQTNHIQVDHLSFFFPIGFMEKSIISYSSTVDQVINTESIFDDVIVNNKGSVVFAEVKRDKFYADTIALIKVQRQVHQQVFILVDKNQVDSVSSHNS